VEPSKVSSPVEVRHTEEVHMRGIAGLTMGVALGALTGCGSSHHDDASKSAAVPQAFQTACSHPGAQVTVSSLPATIRRTACDLTGVTVAYRGSGVTVPENGQTAAAMLDTASGGTELYAVVDAATGDVTIRATN
jgi:hypothetical protein